MTEPASDHPPTDAPHLAPPLEPPRELPPPPFNPLYFGIVAATIEMAVLLWLWLG